SSHVAPVSLSTTTCVRLACPPCALASPWEGEAPADLLKARPEPRPARSGPFILALCQHAGQPQDPLQLPAKDEVMIAKQLLRSRLVEVGEEDLRLGDDLAADHDASL